MSLVQLEQVLLWLTLVAALGIVRDCLKTKNSGII